MTMRIIALSTMLLLAGCSPSNPAPSALAVGNYVGSGRNALCIAGSPGKQRAGFIIYGEGNQNCSARGSISEERGLAWVMKPDGDEACRFDFSVSEGRLIPGPAQPQCAYYCGPVVPRKAEQFVLDTKVPAAADLAGDPLC
jgi:hypothetical protein